MPVSELCNDPGSNQLNKGKELAQKGVKTAVVVQPEVHQETYKEVSIHKDIKATNINQSVKGPFKSDESKAQDNMKNENVIMEEGSPSKDQGIDNAQKLLLSQTPTLNPNIFEQLSSNLKLTIKKENKTHMMDNLQNANSRECMEECTLASNVEYASTSLFNANKFPSLNLNKAAVGAKRRKPVAQDKMGNVKRIKDIESNTLHSIMVPANDLLGENQQLQRSQESKQDPNLKSKVHKKRKRKSLRDMRTKRNKNESCIPITDPETVFTGKLLSSQCNSQNSEVYNQAAELKAKYPNKRKQKLVAMQFATMEVKKGYLTDRDLTADGLTVEQPSLCHSEFLQMQHNSIKRNEGKELCSLAKLPETLNTETDRDEHVCISDVDLETANPEKTRTEKVHSVNNQETPNIERDQKVCMLNKDQEMKTPNKSSVCFLSKDSVSSTNRNEVTCSVSKDSETTGSKFNKTEVVCAVSKDSETANACPSFVSQCALEEPKGNSQPMSEFKSKHQEEMHADIVQNKELTETNEYSNDNTAGSSEASTWHQPSSSIFQVQGASKPITPTAIDTSPGPSSERLGGASAFSVNRVSCESFPLPPLEVDETLIEERREERIRRLKDRLKEQEKALEAIRKTMRPNQ